MNLREILRFQLNCLYLSLFYFITDLCRFKEISIITGNLWSSFNDPLNITYYRHLFQLNCRKQKAEIKK